MLHITYLYQWLLFFNAIRTNPFDTTLLHIRSHLLSYANAFSMEPIFTLITAYHEAIIVWTPANAP